MTLPAESQVGRRAVTARPSRGRWMVAHDRIRLIGTAKGRAPLRRGPFYS